MFGGECRATLRCPAPSFLLSSGSDDSLFRRASCCGRAVPASVLSTRKSGAGAAAGQGEQLQGLR